MEKVALEVAPEQGGRLAISRKWPGFSGLNLGSMNVHVSPYSPLGGLDLKTWPFWRANGQPPQTTNPRSHQLEATRGKRMFDMVSRTVAYAFFMLAMLKRTNPLGVFLWVLALHELRIPGICSFSRVCRWVHPIGLRDLWLGRGVQN